MLLRRTFLGLLESLINLKNYFMIIRVPKMSLLAVTFTQQDSLQSIWWDLIPSIGMFMAVIQNDCSVLECWFYGRGRIKTYHRAREFIAEFFPRTRTDQNKASSTKLYRRTIPQRWANYNQRRQTNQNTHMCLISTSLKYLNAEETILICHMK